MAFQNYKQTESIQTMTARQLRLYISESAAEAQERIDSLKGGIEDLPQAMQDIYAEISGRSGKILKGTSNLSKEEMQYRAFMLRDFNFMDIYSGYAKNADYEANKQRYESFMEGQMQDPLTRSYWEKYKTKTGKWSKTGYKAYKEYINTLKNIQPMIEAYGYETIKDQYVQAKKGKDPQKSKAIERLLVQTFIENKGKGLTQAELNDRFQMALQRWEAAQLVKQIKPKKVKKQSSKQNIKVKTGKKMKGETVRERLT